MHLHRWGFQRVSGVLRINVGKNTYLDSSSLGSCVDRYIGINSMAIL